MSANLKALASVRDLLLPGVHVISKETGRELDMMINFQADTLEVRSVHGPVLTLTRKDIESGGYKTDFASRLRAALRKAA